MRFLCSICHSILKRLVTDLFTTVTILNILPNLKIWLIFHVPQCNMLGWNIFGTSCVCIVGLVCIFLSTYSVHVMCGRWSAIGCGTSDAAYYVCVTCPLAVCKICHAVSLCLFHLLILTVIKYTCSLHRTIRLIRSWRKSQSSHAKTWQTFKKCKICWEFMAPIHSHIVVKKHHTDKCLLLHK